MINEIQADANERMQKSITVLKSSLAKLRAGRAHPSLLDQVQVEYYGSMVPISQVANVSAEDARTLKVSPWEKEMVAPVEKAIMTSDLGLNPNSAGMIIRIPLPALTEQRRQDLVRLVKDEGEKSKVAIRHIRRDANNDFKDLLKEKEVSEDDARQGEEKTQQLTDTYIKEIDKILHTKEVNLMDI